MKRTRYYKKATLKYLPTSSRRLAKGTVSITKHRTVITKFKKK